MLERSCVDLHDTAHKSVANQQQVRRHYKATLGSLFVRGTPCGTSPDECNEATNDPWGLGDVSRGLRRAGALDTALGAVPDPSQARSICEGEPDS